MRSIQNLRPKDFDLSTMDDELQSMALIRALPEAYSSFVDALLLKDKLDKATILHAFQNHEINHSQAVGTLLPSSTALSTSTSTVQCEFC